MGDDVLVVGGGLIGLAIAWRAAQRGLAVTVIDEHPGGGASWAAAGMLAPVTEVHYGEEALLALNLAAARDYPSFVAQLEACSGRGVGYVAAGTLTVAYDADDNAALEHVFRFQQGLGLRVQRLRGSEARGLEPMLGPGVRGGILAPDDHQINNRLLFEALLAACKGSGVVLRANNAVEVLLHGNRVNGVRLDDGSELPAPHVVLAAGCWSGGIAGLPLGTCPLVRPVKGQILRLRTTGGAPFLVRTLRALVRGSGVYLVPRSNGEVVVGATVEEKGFDTHVTVEAVYTLLRDAALLIPGVLELELVESLASLRPGTPDNAPLLGETAIEGLIMATGHYRNGVLLTPVTADAITTLLATGETSALIAPFSPLRFAIEAVAG